MNNRFIPSGRSLKNYNMIYFTSFFPPVNDERNPRAGPAFRDFQAFRL
jgi:hypothetical protein